MSDFLTRLQDVDLSEPTPGPLNFSQAVAGLDLRPPAQIENEARGASATGRSILKNALSAGMPFSEGLPDFDPPPIGNTNYASTFTSGALSTSLNDVSPTKLSSDALRLTADFAARRPNAASFMAPPPAPSDKGTNALQKQVSMRLLQTGVRRPEALITEEPAPAPDPNRPALEANFAKFKAGNTWLSAIKNAPPRPQEKLAALGAAWSDWAQAKLHGPASYPDRPNVPPDLARNILSKLVDAPDDMDATEKRLRESTLEPGEKKALKDMGGWDSVYYAKSRLPFYTVRDRVSLLTGQPVPPNQSPPTLHSQQTDFALDAAHNGHLGLMEHDDSSVPRAFPVTPETLIPVSSFTRDLLGAGQQLGVQQAQYQADLATAFGPSPAGLTGAQRAHAASYFGLPFGEEAYQKSSVLGGFATRYGNLTTGPLVQAGSKAFTDIGPFVLNTALMGAPIAAVGALTSLKNTIGETTVGDPEAITKGYEYAKQRAARWLALGGDDTDRSLVRNADALFGSFPDADVESRIDVGARFFSMASAVDGFIRRQTSPDSAIGGSTGAAAARIFGLGAPSTRLALGNVLEGAFGSFESTALTATMAKPLYNWAQRSFAPRALKDPLLKGAFTEFERDLGGAGSYSSAAPDLRAKMLSPVLQELNTLNSPSAAAEVTSRLSSVLDSQGVPITPESAAAIRTTIQRYADIEQKTAGKGFSEAARSALRDLAEPIADLSDIDQQFVLRGDTAYVGPGGSARRVARIQRFLEKQAEASDAIAEPVATGLRPGELASAIQGMVSENRRVSDFVKRQYRLLDVTADLRRQVVNEAAGHRTALNDHLSLAEDVASSWNSFVDGETRLAQQIETKGHLADTPNPATRTKAFRSLNRALIDHDTPTLVKLASKDAEFQQIFDKVKDQPATVNDLAQWWGRRELQNSLRPVKKTLGPVDRPAADLSDALLNRTAEAAKAKSFVTLSKSELDYLNTYRTARGLDPIKASPAHLDSIVKSADTFRKNLEDSETFVKNVTDFRDNLIRATPDEGFRAAGDASVLKEIRKRLSAPEQALVDKTYVALAHDAPTGTLAGRAAFDEALSRYSAQHHRIETGAQKISSMEMAYIATQNPALLRQALLDHARTAQGVVNRAAARVAELDRIAGRTLSDAERQSLMEDMRTGTPRSDVAAIMLQKQRRWVLDELLDSGAITGNQHYEYTKAAYYHGYYSPDAKLQADASLTLRPNLLPARFASLKVDPADFLGFKIPDDGYYITLRDSGNLRHITRNPDTGALFATAEDASSWLDKTSSIRPGTELSINAPWTVTDREIAGLIYEPVTSHADLMQRASLHASKHRLTALLRDTPFVKPESEILSKASAQDGALQRSGSQYVDSSGNTWTRINSPKLPHLDGTYVEDNMLAHLRLYEESLPWMKSLWEVPEENLRIYGNPLLDLRAKAFVGAGRAASTALRTAGNLFTDVHVGVSFTSALNNLMSNVMYSRYTSLNFFTNPLKFIKNNFDYFTARYRAIEADPYLDALYGHDLIRRAGVEKGVGDLMTRNIEQHWKALEPLQERKTRLESALESTTDPAAQARYATQLELLNNEITAKAPPSVKGFFHSLLNGIKSGVAEMGRLAQGRGTVNSMLWNGYGEFGLDNAIKYANLKHLVEDRGFSMADALNRVATFTQQLHRVPSFVKKSTAHVGGAMFVSYPYEQLRILKEIATREPLTLLMDHALFASMNSAVLAGQGINQRDFLASAALENGFDSSDGRRPFLNDLFTMSSQLLHPDGHGGVSGMSLATLYWDVFRPQSRASQKISGLFDESISSTAGSGNLGALSRGIKNAGLGVASKFILGDLSTELIRALHTGRDQRGDPMESGTDFLKYGLSLFAPPGFPGSSQYDKVKNFATNGDINPRTGRTSSLPELIADLTLRSRTVLDSPSRFQSAMTKVLKSEARLYSFDRQMKYEEMLSTLLARGARNADGTLDEARGTPIIEQFYHDHPRTYPGPDGEEIADPLTDSETAARLKSSAELPAIAAFSRLPLPDQLKVYSLWRSVDTEAPAKDPRWNGLVEDAITARFLKNRSPKPDQVQAALKTMDEWTRAGALPPDASDNVHRWAGRAGQLLLKSLHNR